MLDLFKHERPQFGRLAKRRRRKYFAYAGLLLFAGVSLTVILGYISSTETLMVTRITVEGNERLSSDSLIASTDSFLDGKYVWLFSKRNSLIFPKKSISEALPVLFPEIENFSVYRDSLNSLRLSIQERAPNSIWCERFSSEKNNVLGNCYFADEKGFLFSRAPQFSDSPYLLFVGDVSSTTPLGRAVLPTEKFKELLFFARSLKSMNLNPKRIEIEKRGSVSDMNVVLKNGVSLLVSGSRTLDSTLDDISTFFNDPEIASSSNKFLETVSYIDFRFPHKVYYKEK